MLRVEACDVISAEIGNRQIAFDDVERACVAQRLPVRTDARLVVADVAHPDERDRRGEWGRIPCYVAVAQLAQERDQRIVRKAIHLIEENGERLVRRRCDPRQKLAHVVSLRTT